MYFMNDSKSLSKCRSARASHATAMWMAEQLKREISRLREEITSRSQDEVAARKTTEPEMSHDTKLKFIDRELKSILDFLQSEDGSNEAKANVEQENNIHPCENNICKAKIAELEKTIKRLKYELNAAQTENVMIKTLLPGSQPPARYYVKPFDLVGHHITDQTNTRTVHKSHKDSTPAVEVNCATDRNNKQTQSKVEVCKAKEIIMKAKPVSKECKEKVFKKQLLGKMLCRNKRDDAKVPNMSMQDSNNSLKPNIKRNAVGCCINFRKLCCI